jgi:hypothetical protein
MPSPSLRVVVVRAHCTAMAESSVRCMFVLVTLPHLTFSTPGSLFAREKKQ